MEKFVWMKRKLGRGKEGGGAVIEYRSGVFGMLVEGLVSWGFGLGAGSVSPGSAYEIRRRPTKLS